MNQANLNYGNKLRYSNNTTIDMFHNCTNFCIVDKNSIFPPPPFPDITLRKHFLYTHVQSNNVRRNPNR